MKNMLIDLNDENLFGIIAAGNDALQSVIEDLMKEKGESGSVTIKINLGKYAFSDGYKKMRNGLNIDYKVDTTITNKTSHGDRIATEGMMLAESDTFGYVLAPAPDPQMNVDDWYTENFGNDTQEDS